MNSEQLKVQIPNSLWGQPITRFNDLQFDTDNHDTLAIANEIVAGLENDTECARAFETPRRIPLITFY